MTHGYASRFTRSRTYNIWNGMRGRCKDAANPWYGSRGIAVCERWREGFENFLADMGPCPSNRHSLDRINNDGNYEPSNCRWVTAKEQNRNTRVCRYVQFEGKRLSMRDACEIVGLPHTAVIQRLDAGWSDERALTTPLRGSHHA